MRSALGLGVLILGCWGCLGSSGAKLGWFAAFGGVFSNSIVFSTLPQWFLCMQSCLPMVMGL